MLRECQAQKDGPPNDDIRIRAFAIAAEQSLIQNPHFTNAVSEMIENRPGYETPYVFNLLLRAVQKQELKNRLELRYPNAYDRPQRWVDAIARAVDPKTYDDSDFRYDILSRDIQTNKVQRYVSAVIFRALAADRIGEEPVVVDVGCSQNLGNKQQAFKDFLYFESLGVAPYGIQLPDTREWPRNKVLSERTNRLVWNMKRHAIGYGLGIDPWDIEDEDNRLWVEACSFYPGEMVRDEWPVSESRPDGLPDETGNELVDHYSGPRFFAHQVLQKMSIDNVGFYPVDFTKVDPREVLDELPDGKKPSLITMFTMLHQLKNDAARHKALRNALEIVDKDGYILVKDFADIDKNHKNRLVINPAGTRQVGKFKLYMVDPRNPTEEFIHLATYNNGRCVAVQFQPALGNLALAHEYGLSV